MTGDLIIAAGLIALSYFWLWYSMNVLHNPLLDMLVYYPVFCFAFGTYLGKRRPRKAPEYSFKLELRRKPVILTVILSLAASIVLWGGLVVSLRGLLDPSKISEGLASCGMDRANFWLIGWVVAVINPIFEEYLWRFSVFPFLERRFSRRIALHVSSLLFAGYHPIVVGQFFPFAWLIVVFVMVYIAGIIFATLLTRTRNLVYPIMLHLWINLNFMLMTYLFAPSM